MHRVSSFCKCHSVAFGALEIKHTGMLETLPASTTGYLAAPIGKDKKLQKIITTLAFLNTNKTNNMGSFLIQWNHVFCQTSS